MRSDRASPSPLRLRIALPPRMPGHSTGAVNRNSTGRQCIERAANRSSAVMPMNVAMRGLPVVSPQPDNPFLAEAQHSVTRIAG